MAALSDHLITVTIFLSVILGVGNHATEMRTIPAVV